MTSASIPEPSPTTARGGVSVVIPCFNHARYLPEAIESVLTQDCARVDVVVVDDGSDDDTASVAATYPVHCVGQLNSGLAASRNRGVRESVGEYLVFLDADDRLVAGALTAQLARLSAQPTWAFVSGQHRYISPQGDVIEAWEGNGVTGDHYALMLRKNYIGCCSAVMFRRSVLDAVGRFDTSYRVCEDYDLYLRIVRQFDVGAHGDLIADYRRYPESLSGDPAAMLDGVLRALDAQRPFVRGNPALENARRDGVAFWRRYYGEPLADRARRQLACPGQRIAGLRNLFQLARHAPHYVARAVGRGTAPPTGQGTTPFFR